VNRRCVTDCYLCGKPLGGPINVDHVPPKMFYATDVRKTYNLSKLITVPVHAACNTAWQKDEEYFVNTLLPVTRGSVSGDALWADYRRRLRSRRNVPLANMVLKEFKHQIGGVLLPRSKVAKTFNGERVWGVIWKIIRGLHFHHTGEILPKHWEFAATITPPGGTPSDSFLAFAQSGMMESRGEYQGVFAYAFKFFSGVPHLHYWAFNLWDRIIFTAVFHDPQCGCEDCAFVGPRQVGSRHRTTERGNQSNAG
jgi:hypothetical protein